MSNLQTLSLSKDNIKILLLEGIDSGAVETFLAAGYNNVVSMDHALTENELITALSSVHLLGIRSRTELTEKVLASAKKLISIGCFCIGTNQVSLIDAQKKGIPVFNAPFANTRSVAELVLAEIICLYRGVVDKHINLMAGKWQKSAKGAHEVRGKTLGIVGYGHIGSQLGILAENLGMLVQYYDVESKLSLGNAKSVQQLSDLLKTSDIISLHVPQTPETKQMIDHKAFALMKKGALLINASRGNVVDVDSLCEALKSKALLGAAVDVFPQEPESKEVTFKSSLQELSNVILTPHIGGATEEAQKNISIDVAAKLIKYSDNGTTMTAANFPEVNLPANNGSCRLLHIHWNKPGVLAKVNKVFSDAKANVVGQYLQTNENVGYVVLDVAVSSGKDLREVLMSIPETIKTRVLNAYSG